MKNGAGSTKDNAIDYTPEQLAELQAEAASEALKSSEGWNCITQFQTHIYAQLVNTSQFVIPVLNDLDVICEQVNDPDGFRRSFATLMADIAALKAEADRLCQKHKGKSGAPTPAEYPIIFTLSQEYSNLMTRYEQGVQPLIESLNRILTEECTPASDQSESH